MNIGVLALVGTRKGLFLLSGHDHRRCWPLDGPLLDSWAVYHATVDARDETIYAAANHIVYGPAASGRPGPTDDLFPFRKAKTAGGPRP